MVFRERDSGPVPWLASRVALCRWGGIFLSAPHAAPDETSLPLRCSCCQSAARTFWSAKEAILRDNRGLPDKSQAVHVRGSQGVKITRSFRRSKHETRVTLARTLPQEQGARPRTEKDSTALSVSPNWSPRVATLLLPQNP